MKIIVFGAPVTDEFAKEVGADSHAPDTATAVDNARSLVA